MTLTAYEKEKLENYRDNYKIAYNTEITCDVEGYLTDEDVRNLLARIKGR